MAAALYLGLLLLAIPSNAKMGDKPVTSAAPRSGWWPALAAKQAQEMKAADEKGGVQLLFLGDSITESWRGTDSGQACNSRYRSSCSGITSVFKRYFGQYRTAFQAIGGDQVMHLVYRMEHGALPKASQPRVVVLMIGTNDLGTVGYRRGWGAQKRLMSTAPGVASRVEDAVRLLRSQLPDAQVVLLGLLPRGTGSGEGRPVGDNDHGWPSAYTEAIEDVNSRLRSSAEGQSDVRFLDCGPRFLASGGTRINAALMPDALHPSRAGHERGLAQCIKPLVDQLMQG